MTPKLGPLDYSKTTLDALAKWAQQGEPKRTSSHANRARVAVALGKWMDEGAKKKPKQYGRKQWGKRGTRTPDADVRPCSLGETPKRGV